MPVPLKFRMKLDTGLLFGGNQVPGRMMSSRSTYTLDANGQIEVHQIDIEALRAVGFVLVAHPDGHFPGASGGTLASLPDVGVETSSNDAVVAATPQCASPGGRVIHLSPAPALGSGITQLTDDVTAGPGSGSHAATIPTHVVTNTGLTQMGANTLKGKTSSRTANATDLTATQATVMLNAMVVPPAAGITQLTGDVTAGPGSGSQATTIAANVVGNAKLAQMAAHTFKGNNSGSAANPSDLTASQLTAELNSMVGDSGSGGTKGLAPAPAAGDAAAGRYLQADGTWAIPLGSGITQLTGDIAAAPDFWTAG
jgi:hypothetical protein